MSKYLIVSLHDVHPGSLETIQQQVADLEAVGVKQFSQLVVPHYHHQTYLRDSSSTLAWLGQRAAAGDDMILHGFYHDRGGQPAGSWFWDRVYTADESEFLDLSDGEVRHRVRRGKALWEEFGWPLHGFIAPAWLMPVKQDALLREEGFLFTTRLATVKNLAKDKVTNSQSLCYSSRAAWRRSVSLLWNQTLFSRLGKGDVVRLSLHPGDWQWPALRRQILEIAEMALAGGFEAITYAGYARKM